MHVHLIGVAGTGMGALAGLLADAGHDVSGSDVAFYPPMGPALKRWGIRTVEGFSASNLEPAPDLVVVGNVCRATHVEAAAARAEDGRRWRVTTMPQALAELVLDRTAPLVVAGTHGKTTTSSMCAWLLAACERDPGFLIGGIPKNFDRSFRLPGGFQLPGGRARRLPLHRPVTPGSAPARRTPFVVEGDEYDTAFFEKTPKFWHYLPEVAVITSMEHDHVDIYADEASYRAAFQGFVERVPAHGLLVAHAGDPAVVQLVRAHAIAPVVWYGVAGEVDADLPVHWLAAPAAADASGQSFDLYASGGLVGRASLRLGGRHNLSNATAALAASSEGFGVPVSAALDALARFEGVARRQDLLGEVDGVRVYDDFAHHPTAVRETLRGFRQSGPTGKLWAVYEPRTATACRALHQRAYAEAFGAADEVVLAPLGRDAIAADERLDVDLLVAKLRAGGTNARLAASVDAIVGLLRDESRTGDVVVLLSNGAFGGIHGKLLDALRSRAA